MYTGARCYDMQSHTRHKYVAYATCCDLKYVPSKFKEKPFKDKRTLNHARSHAVREHEKCADRATCGDL
jgi:hypothetical protein